MKKILEKSGKSQGISSEEKSGNPDSGFETHEEGHMEVQNRSKQWLHKMDLGPNKKFKKKQKKTTLTISWQIKAVQEGSCSFAIPEYL